MNCRFCQYLKLNQIPVHSQLSSPYPSWSTLISSQVLSTINKHLEHFIHISHYITSVPGNLSVITYLTLYFNLTLYRHFIHLSHYTHTHITYLISHRFFLLSHSYVSYVWQGADGTDAAVIAARKAWVFTMQNTRRIRSFQRVTNQLDTLWLCQNSYWKWP